MDKYVEIPVKNYSLLFLISLAALLTACGPKWTETERKGIRIVTNQGGQTLGYSPESGVKLLTVDRFAFKDLNQNGELDPYEDWRLPAEERAADLARQMSVEQIAGLMLYSSHQGIPGGGYRGGTTYGGKPFRESGAKPSGLLPLQMPAGMATVEKQMEDVPFDMTTHVDTEGNTYGFGFGLNWSGVIEDERTAKYKTGAQSSMILQR